MDIRHTDYKVGENLIRKVLKDVDVTTVDSFMMSLTGYTFMKGFFKDEIFRKEIMVKELENLPEKLRNQILLSIEFMDSVEKLYFKELKKHMEKQKESNADE